MKIAILTGSNRGTSSSTRMCCYIGERLISQGHAVDLWNLHLKPLPFYDPDEETVSEAAAELGTIVADADAVVLASPEYHGSVSGVLKNALDH